MIIKSVKILHIEISVRKTWSFFFKNKLFIIISRLFYYEYIYLNYR